MKTITITISKAEALHQANLRNYYAGESAKVGDMVEIATKMQTSEDNADVMEKFVIDAATHLVQVLAPVCIDVQVELGDTITYTIKVSDLYAESQTNVRHLSILSTKLSSSGCCLRSLQNRKCLQPTAAL